MNHPVDIKKYRITQKFGGNPDTYARFGMKGHNGIDYATPKGTPIPSPHAGRVLEVAYDEKGYGKYVKVESDTEGSVLAHLDSFNVKVGDNINEGHITGYADSTGFSTGHHLHWGYYRLPRNRQNGYAGFIDPMPYLSEEKTDTISIKKSDFERLVTKSTGFDAVIQALELPTDATQDSVLRSISATKGLIGTLQREKAELESEVKNRVDQLARDRELCQSEKTLLEQAVKNEVRRYEQLESGYKALRGEYTQVRKDLGKTKNELAVCEAGNLIHCSWLGRVLGLCK